MDEPLTQYPGPAIDECVFCRGREYETYFLGPVVVGICPVCICVLAKEKLVAQGRWPR